VTQTFLRTPAGQDLPSARPYIASSVLELGQCGDRKIVRDQRSTGARSSQRTHDLYAYAVHLGLIAIVVKEYDPAISFFVDALGFELVEDTPALTNDGRPKRWVVVRPPGAVTGLLASASCRGRPGRRRG